MDPRLNAKGSRLIVLAEWKPIVYDNHAGIRLITFSQRRNNPQFLDSKIHHSNLLKEIDGRKLSTGHPIKYWKKFSHTFTL